MGVALERGAGDVNALGGPRNGVSIWWSAPFTRWLGDGLAGEAGTEETEPLRALGFTQ